MKTFKQDSGSILRSVFRSALLAMIIAKFAEVIAAAIDGILTGRYLGAKSLAAFGIARPFFSITGVFSAVLSSGAMILTSHCIGKGDIQKSRQLFSVTCFLGIILSVTAAILGIVFVNPLTKILGANSDLFPYVRLYLLGLFTGIPAIVMSNVLTVFLQIEGKYKHVTLGVFATIIVNLGGDAFNIFYLNGNMFGIGLATSASYYVSLTVLLISFLRQKSMMRFSFKDINLKLIFELLNKGMPKATRRVCNIIRPVVINNAVIIIGGSLAMSALSIQNSTSDLMELLGTCLADAIVLLCGIFYGEENKDEILNTLKMAFRYVIFGVTAITVLCFLGAEQIASFFLIENIVHGGISVIDVAVTCIKLYALKLPLLAFNEIYIAYFQALGDTRRSDLLSMLHRLIYIVISVFILGRLFGIMGVWAAFPVSELLLTMTILIMAVIREKRFPRKISDMLFLPKNFGVSPDNRFHAVIRTYDDVMKASTEAFDFCKDKGITQKRAVLVSLCIEELGMNDVKYGFKKKNQMLEVNLTVIGNNLKLRFRDNGRKFDLKQWLEFFHSEDPASHIGIRMLFALADKISYTNTMNTNNIIVDI